MFVVSGLYFEGVVDFVDLMCGDVKFVLGVVLLYQGFIFGDECIVFIIEIELYVQIVCCVGCCKQEQVIVVDLMVCDLVELKIGDLVVYSEYGIGCYQGLVFIDMGNGEEEFLYFDYDKGSKFYVLVYQLYVILCYLGVDLEIVLLYLLGFG